MHIKAKKRVKVIVNLKKIYLSYSSKPNIIHNIVPINYIILHCVLSLTK